MKFYKIISEGNMKFKQLRIPEHFVRNFGTKISDVAKFMVPDGRIWLVAISKKKKKKDAWFHNGFDEFMEYYSIRASHVLLFNYNGASSFKVHIYDKSGCEILYPCCGPSDSEEDWAHDDGEMEDEDGDSVDTSGQDESEETTEDYSDDSSERDDSDDADYLVSDLEEDLPEKNKKTLCGSSKTAKRSIMKPAKKTNDDSKKAVNCGEKQVAIRSSPIKRLHQSTLFKEYSHCYNPKEPHFIVLLRKYNMRRMGYIPIFFARVHLGKETKSIEVEDLKGEKKWTLGLLWRKKDDKDTYIYKGWKKFLMDNELEVGDVCGFELIKKEPEVCSERKKETEVTLKFTKLPPAAVKDFSNELATEAVISAEVPKALLKSE